MASTSRNTKMSMQKVPLSTTSCFVYEYGEFYSAIVHIQSLIADGKDPVDSNLSTYAEFLNRFIRYSQINQSGIGVTANDHQELSLSSDRYGWRGFLHPNPCGCHHEVLSGAEAFDRSIRFFRELAGVEDEDEGNDNGGE